MFYIMAILAAIFAMPAKADETLKWRHVQHTASAQTLQVSDVNGHVLGLDRTPGIAFFPDGSTGATLVIATGDTNNGAGTVDGYFTLTFNDGSELWTKFTGTNSSPFAPANRPLPPITAKVPFRSALLPSRGGSYEGDGAPIGPDAITYIDNVVNIKK
jgi:hypothetical protein